MKILLLAMLTLSNISYYEAIVQLEGWQGVKGKNGEVGPLQITPKFYADGAEQLHKENQAVPPYSYMVDLKYAIQIADAYYRKYNLVTTYDKARAHNNGPSYKGRSDYAQRAVNLFESNKNY